MGIEARTIRLRLGVIGVGLLLLCAFASSSMAADLKIGFTFSLTGGTDDAGKGARMGAELALAEYNERGGYKGQKVEAIIYDDETKPAKGVENVTRLITRDKVFAIVGPVNSGVALAIVDIAQKNQNSADGYHRYSGADRSALSGCTEELHFSRLAQRRHSDVDHDRLH